MLHRRRRSCNVGEFKCWKWNKRIKIEFSTYTNLQFQENQLKLIMLRLLHLDWVDTTPPWRIFFYTIHLAEFLSFHFLIKHQYTPTITTNFIQLPIGSDLVHKILSVSSADELPSPLRGILYSIHKSTCIIIDYIISSCIRAGGIFSKDDLLGSTENMFGCLSWPERFLSGALVLKGQWSQRNGVQKLRKKFGNHSSETTYTSKKSNRKLR